MAYVGRLAPSPTGLLHLGHAATFWTAYTRARAHRGTLLFRNEDLDPQRSRLAFVDAMLEDLAWLGIAWQPPMISQSQRLPAYRAAFARLLESGAIYPCTCSRKDLARMMHAPHDEDDEPLYDGRCRTAPPLDGCPKPALSEAEGSDGFSSAVGSQNPSANYRFRVPDGETVRFLDGNLGAQAITAGSARGTQKPDFGDFLVWRKPVPGDPHPGGLPSYQLACVVDDAAMGVTEVVRGADLLKSAARQILLQRVLGLPAVDYFHTALLRDEHGVRVAKRHDALALRTLREQGLTPADVRARCGLRFYSS